jgi:hypothetical protein
MEKILSGIWLITIAVTVYPAIPVEDIPYFGKVFDTDFCRRMIIPPFGVVPLAETQGEQNVIVRLVFEYLAETAPYVPADTSPIRVTVFIILPGEIFSVTA